MTVSLWQRSGNGDIIQADCIVIGAGICGLSAALHLERRGADVVVLERTIIGGGASSRNAGFLMRGAAENYAAAIRIYGRDLAKLIWRWTEENLAGLREEGIESVPGYSARPSCLLALEEPEHSDLRESVMLMREDGFAVEWLDHGNDHAWKNLSPLGGLLNPNDAVCHPLNLLHHLASKLKRPVYEQREVFGLQATGGDVEILTRCGRYRAKRILFCTNAYAPLLLGSLAEFVMPRRGQILAVQTEAARLEHAYYANYGYEYFRRVDTDMVIFGGCRRSFAEAETGYEDRTTSDVQSALEAFAARTLGVTTADLDVRARWSGTMGFSPDGLPLVGAVSGEWEQDSVWFCGAFTGHGMSLAHRVSRCAVEGMYDGPIVPLSFNRVKNRQLEGDTSPAH